jgi:hypothetical protein
MDRYVIGNDKSRGLYLLEEFFSIIAPTQSIIEGEYAENEMRKDFTKSERVAIAEALEREMGERRGNPNLKKGNDLSISLPVDELREQGRTDFIVAKKAGLGSKDTYRCAKKVVNQGIDELKTAMDLDKISIKDAAVVAEQPEQEQRRIISLPCIPAHGIVWL